jgi:hypothetical protein
MTCCRVRGWGKEGLASVGLGAPKMRRAMVAMVARMVEAMD